MSQQPGDHVPHFGPSAAPRPASPTAFPQAAVPQATFPPPGPSQPAPAEPVPSLPAGPGALSGPARSLVLVAAALALVIYLLGFFGQVSVIASFGGPLLIGGGLLAGTAVLPRSGRVLAPAAVLIVTGTLLLAQLATSIGGLSIVVAALALALAQCAAVIGAVLLDAGLIRPSAARQRPFAPQYPAGYQGYPTAGGPGPGYGPPGYSAPPGYGAPPGYSGAPPEPGGPGGHQQPYPAPPAVAIGPPPPAPVPGPAAAEIPGSDGSEWDDRRGASDDPRPPDASSDPDATTQTGNDRPGASGMPAADPTTTFPTVDPRAPARPVDPGAGGGRHGRPEEDADRPDPPSHSEQTSILPTIKRPPG
jgi:Family of unknown function (DUF5336)